MVGPIDLRTYAEPPAKLFTATEANALLPAVEAIFVMMDAKLARLRELRDLAEDYEAYWRDAVYETTNPERQGYAKVLIELADVRASIDADAAKIRKLGCELKDPQMGLVDFYASINGELAYLCWRRGEARVAHWHTLEAGYAGRKPLPAESRAEP